MKKRKNRCLTLNPAAFSHIPELGGMILMGNIPPLEVMAQESDEVNPRSGGNAGGAPVKMT